MRRFARRASIWLGAMAVAAAIAADEKSATPAHGAGPGPTEAEWVQILEQGPFIDARGPELKKHLDAALDKAEWGDGSDARKSAARATLQRFFEAFSSTDFDDYLRFRPKSTMAPLDHPRLVEILAVWTQAHGDRPKESADVMRSAWSMYVSKGMKPIAPGPLVSQVAPGALNIRTGTASLAEAAGPEWAEDATEGGALHKRHAADPNAPQHAILLRKVVPTGRDPGELAKSAGGVLAWLELSVVCRAATGHAHPVRLLFVWDAADSIWLPWQGISVQAPPSKPFIW